jgi:hypothetical protein
VNGIARALRSALGRSSPFAREIALVLLVKTLLLVLLLRALSHGPAPSRPVAQQRAAQQLLGVAAVSPQERAHGR